ncbi:DUF2865 domain-containing protein [Tardiphaga alba]|nr:DUF2865 domain-containing protein [Tardiphaga alba]
MISFALMAGASAAHAQDFFSAFFGGIARGRMPDISMPFEDGPRMRAERPRAVGQAYCVRTCDGRYFPISATDTQSRATSCNSFCPASKTEVVYGSAIDHATTENGKAYSDLPNAFKFRNEIVAGCTCNGKDQFGLAQVKIEDDPTLRKGDIVAGTDGLKSVTRTDKRGASLNMTPVPASIAAKFERVPVVARE